MVPRPQSYWDWLPEELQDRNAYAAYAMERLKAFEGIPAPYDTKKRMVVPDAFRQSRLKVGRRYCVLGRISDEIGWKQKEVVATLEKKRMEAAAAYWDTKKALLAKTAAGKEANPGAPILAEYGY